jgi:pimeloyl-ACP methyl ester carboxylesterase
MSTTDIDEKAPVTAEDTGSQLRAENRSVEVDGATLVYRRFGNQGTDALPLVCLQHFRGNLDFWDPTLVDRLARDREVILLANRGVGAASRANFAGLALPAGLEPAAGRLEVVSSFPRHRS